MSAASGSTPASAGGPNPATSATSAAAGPTPGIAAANGAQATAAADAAAERNALVRALVEVCDERGYLEATPRLVEERAGLERGAFARSFDSLEDCFLAIWDLGFDDIGQKLLDAYSRGRDWREKLRATSDELLRLLRKRRNPIARVLVLNSDAAGGRAAARRAQFIRSFAQLIDAGRFELDDEAWVTDQTALVLAASVHHAVYSRLLAGRASELEQMMPQLISLIVTQYLGHEAGLAELEAA